MSATPYTILTMGELSIQARFGENDWEKYAYQATPLFRWAGGKRRFILANSNKFPEFTGTYHEPFAGSLAVYFWMAAKNPTPLKARVADVNLRLIRTYQQIKNEPQQVWEYLRELVTAFNQSSDPSAYFYRVREEFNLTNPRPDAARFLFLMAAGWNGVYRTNSKSQFNVPFGNNANPKFPSESDIHIASVVLQYADIRACSWDTSIASAIQGDFIFLDPPYLTSDDKETQIYEKNQSFDFVQHEKMAKELVNLQNRGVDFMLTNSCTNSLISMYRDLGLSVEVIASHRSISRNVDERGDQAELIVTPGKTESKKQRMEDEFQFNLRLKGLEK